MNELVRQAARLQRKIERTKEELRDEELTVRGTGERVAVTVTLGGKLRRIEVLPEFVAGEGLELALDAVVVTANQALEKANQQLEAEISKATGGLKVPGLT
jgi:DNA-binding protein YbaB